MQFLTEALAKEAAGSGVIVGAISPGLVITEGFLREHAKTPPEMRAGREAVVNLIGDHVETVASWIVRRITTNADNGHTFVWLTPAKLRRRKQTATLRPRDILARYRKADGRLGLS